MKTRKGLLISSDNDQREIRIIEFDELTSSAGMALCNFKIDMLKRMGRVGAAKWIGQAVVALLSGLQESFYDMDKSKESYPVVAPSEVDVTALEHLCIAMSLVVRAVELDSAYQLNEARLHLVQARAAGLDLADDLIETLLPKLQSSLRTDF